MLRSKVHSSHQITWSNLTPQIFCMTIPITQGTYGKIYLTWPMITSKVTIGNQTKGSGARERKTNSLSRLLVRMLNGPCPVRAYIITKTNEGRPDPDHIDNVNQTRTFVSNYIFTFNLKRRWGPAAFTLAHRTHITLNFKKSLKRSIPKVIFKAPKIDIIANLTGHNWTHIASLQRTIATIYGGTSIAVHRRSTQLSTVWKNKCRSAADAISRCILIDKKPFSNSWKKGPSDKSIFETGLPA